MKLSARAVSYAYRPGQPVLRGVSLEVGEGEALFLLGPNGSGKTTLLECLAGLRPPLGGEVLLGGDALYRLPPAARARAIAYVPQVHRPVFGYAVLEVVLMGRTPHLGPFSSPGRRDEELAREALAAVGLAQLMARPYTELSGGEMRLVLIARGLAQGAACLLLDEPDAHLDPSHQHRVLELVRGFPEKGITPVVTTHSPNNALAYAQRVALLAAGRILAEGPPGAVLTPAWLNSLYGMEFKLLVGEEGERALIPATGMGVRARDETAATPLRR